MEIFSATTENMYMKPKKLVEAMLSPEMRPERVGARVTAIRETMRMNKADFADSVGIDRSALTRIENGAEGLSVAKATIIADLYGFGLNFIYRGAITDTPPDRRPELLLELHALRSLPPDVSEKPAES